MLDRYFSKVEIKESKEYLKICSSSPAIKDMKIKSTLRFYLMPVRILKINNATNNKFCKSFCENGIIIHSWWNYKLVYPLLWKPMCKMLKKLETYLPYYLTILLISIMPQIHNILLCRYLLNHNHYYCIHNS